MQNMALPWYSDMCSDDAVMPCYVAMHESDVLLRYVTTISARDSCGSETYAARDQQGLTLHAHHILVSYTTTLILYTLAILFPCRPLC
jgi:hypothetical protein